MPIIHTRTGDRLSKLQLRLADHDNASREDEAAEHPKWEVQTQECMDYEFNPQVDGGSSETSSEDSHISDQDVNDSFSDYSGSLSDGEEQQNSGEQSAVS